jgi:hypothetical protein
MTVTFKIGTTDVTPTATTINPISAIDPTSSWKYYVYYPSQTTTTSLIVSYDNSATGYMCIQSPGGSGGSTTNSVYGGGGGGGQVYVKSLGVSSDLSITIYGMGSEKDTTVTDTTSGYISIGAGKNGTNGTTDAYGDGGDGGNTSSNCKGGGGGNVGSSYPYNESNNNVVSGKPGNGYFGGTTGSFSNSVPGYVSVAFEDGTTANLGSGGKQKIAGNTPFVMVYYPI